ncbi:S8 family serine peptidase [Solwaraspora sp. WMMD406]|uniref:S8 family serine peptidase n=1 Tax=Solwaraspora sp. WMMD406 TaxID=3016095 RepID=UPI00241780C8|nr:S8 family serine peptidase [Solwaraspora sp. WMMD406]MDG4767931.1 S8 family serine peptidase [Solwaraspora sp. WMMD406]
MSGRKRTPPPPWTRFRRLLAAAASAVLAGGLLAAPAAATPVGDDAAPGAAPKTATATIAAELRTTVAESTGERIQALLMLPNPQRYPTNPDTAVDQLRTHAQEVQDEVETALEERAETAGDVRVVNRFWITNMLLVEFTADASRLAALAALPGVQRVLPNFTLSLPDTEMTATADPAAAIIDGRITWGLDRIGAEKVWTELGLDGTGVRVVTLDTGVAINHPDLVGKMATDDPTDPTYPGGWMEFSSSGGLVSSQPRDSSTHGTHVSGTIHGGAASGVIIGGAPGAEMAHGLVIPGGSGSFTQVAAGMQWAIAPTDAAGNPAGRPADVVSMSLGAASYSAEMIAPTRAIVAAGAFPSFAIGNEDIFGSCGVGSSSPGNVYEAVGVGATDIDDNVADFSCGNVVNKSSWASPPADWPDSWVTPDLSAPGDEVWSASPDGSYRYASGTSMATPHTSAVAALLLQGAPELSVDATRTALIDTAFWDDRYADVAPDTRYGHGRIDAYAAASQVALDSGVTGAVTTAGTSAPIADAVVTVTPGGASVRTGDDGAFTLRLPPGDYTLTASAFGHETTSASAVVVEESFTTVDLALEPLPIGVITGAATFEESGHGVPGVTITVTADGAPVDRTVVTGADGAYRIELPAGDYRVAADHPRFAASPPVEVTVPDGGTVTTDFTLRPPPQTVALVGSYAESYAEEIFTPRGIETVIYDWSELADAAEHSLVVLGYGVSSNYNEATFQAFLDATDAAGTGVIFTDHAYSTGNGIRQLSRHTGQPVSTGSNTGGTGVAESFYEVTATHPILDGYAVGDRIPLDTSTQAKWIAWFGDYSGEGRQTLADLGRSDATGIYGGGIGVDQRPTNRHVLLSTHGVSVTRGPVDWSPEATEVFLNAVDWAARPAEDGQPYFAVHGLTVGPDEVKSDEPVTVTVQVKNVGASAGPYQAVLRVDGEPAATTTVTLDSGANRSLTWTISEREIGDYAVSVEYLTDSFRVRPPRVSLTARTVDAPDAAPGPLAGATVELIHDGAVVPVGATGDDGTLTFETPAAVDRYTLVVRRAATEADGTAYLLHRVITVIDDDEVVFAPRVLAGGMTEGSTAAENLSTRMELAAEQVDDAHEALVYLRSTGTAPWAYPFGPGPLVASLDTYQAVAVHQVPRLEQDWWLVSEILSDLDWTEPFDGTLPFGGAPKVEVAASVPAPATAEVDWSVTDAYGHPFATVRATEVRPFADLPAVTRLEDVAAAVRTLAPVEARPVLRLSAPDGTPVRGGYVNWADRPYTFEVDDPQPGRYQLELELDTGWYGGSVDAETSVVLAPAATLTADYPAAAEVDGWVHPTVRAVNSSGVDQGTAALTLTVTHPDGDLLARDLAVQVRVDDAWVRVPLTVRDGALTATLAPEVALPAGADHTWLLHTRARRAGEFTFTHELSGDGVSVTASSVVSVVPATAGYGALPV